MARVKWTFQIILLLMSIKGMPQNLDSLENVLKTKNLSVKEQLKLYDKLSWKYIGIDIDKSKRLSRQGIAISLKEKNDKMCGILYQHIGIACYNNGETDSAWHYFRTAETFSQKAKDDFRLDRIYIAYAILYSSDKQYDKSIEILLKLIPELEKRKDGDLIRTAYGNLGTMYLYIHNYALSEKYYQLCAEKSIEAKDDWKLSQSYNGLIDIYIEKKDYKKALEYADKALEVAQRCGDNECQALTYRKKSQIYSTHYNDFNKALEFGEKGLAVARNGTSQSNIAELLINLSDISLQKNEYRQAMDYALEALRTDTTDLSVYENIAANIVKSGICLNDKERAVKYLRKYYDIVESRSKKEVHQFAIDSEKKYQTEKKELQIAGMKKQAKLMTVIGIGGGVLLLLFIVLIYYRYKITKHKKQLVEQRVVQLEKERQLIAAKSLLEGEESERARLAGDLHDGLGGLLSGVKLKLSSMKENAVITHENIVHFSHALDLLDSSIAELRRVAHNLMPETLMHYGLRTALNDFIRQAVPEGKPVIGFSSFGGELRFSKELEVTVYRIAQELITNAVKHAQAKRVDVQLFTEPNRICVQVVDNGIGFDPDLPDTSTEGKGLKNIRDRVTAFHGQFEILSQPGKGTETTVEFFVN